MDESVDETVDTDNIPASDSPAGGSTNRPSQFIVEGNTTGGWKGGIGTPAVSDTVDSTPTVTNDAPDLFPLGRTVVTWTATDQSRNSATATQEITVVDTTPPALTAPADITVEGNTIAGWKGDIGNATATDIVDASPVITSDTLELFPVGTTVVTWTATDASGNSASATQTVMVTDNTPPLISAPTEITSEVDTMGGWAPSTAVAGPIGQSMDGTDDTVTEDSPGEETEEAPIAADELEDTGTAADPAAATEPEARREIDDDEYRLLAEATIGETRAVAVVNPKRQHKVDQRLAEADKELARGDSEWTSNRFNRAAGNYKKALKHAQSAATEAVKN